MVAYVLLLALVTPAFAALGIDFIDPANYESAVCLKNQVP